MATRFSFGSRGNGEQSRQVYETSRQNGPPTTQGIGAVLRERREAMGATLAETEAATRIRQKYLAALESDEWHLLPGEVVGRGFLRNYAGYLGLEPTEIIERRRMIANDSVAPMLVNTSAGSSLPPMRQVDYRPKEVDLRDEPDVMETRELRLAPWLGGLAVILLAALLWWGRDTVASQAGNAYDFTRQQVATLVDSLSAPPATPTAAAQADAGNAGVVNPANLGEDDATSGSMTTETEGASGAAPSQAPQPVGGGNGATAGDGGSADTQGDAGAQPGGQSSVLAALLPTPTPSFTPTAPSTAPDEPTPTPVPPTETPVPPTPTPEEPTPTPEPEILPPVCADPNSSITAPGVGQVVSGIVGVTGTANSPAFQYYKLEYALGANAGGGFVYFDGQNTPVVSGLLGNFNSASLPSGEYTLQVVVVDQTGNFAPPCRVSITVQN